MQVNAKMRSLGTTESLPSATGKSLAVQIVPSTDPLGLRYEGCAETSAEGHISSRVNPVSLKKSFHVTPKHVNCCSLPGTTVLMSSFTCNRIIKYCRLWLPLFPSILSFFHSFRFTCCSIISSHTCISSGRLLCDRQYSVDSKCDERDRKGCGAGRVNLTRPVSSVPRRE